ncbi:MAG: hypothetical protein CM15mV26_0060 [uncultured marine virus]|nr:MAG: hypothetical protein CM15mV26_0060 [uncultured marine virus]
MLFLLSCRMPPVSFDNQLDTIIFGIRRRYESYHRVENKILFYLEFFGQDYEGGSS